MDFKTEKGYILVNFIAFLALSIILLSVSLSLWQIIEIKKVYLKKKNKLSNNWILEEENLDYQLSLFSNKTKQTSSYDHEIRNLGNSSLSVLKTSNEDDLIYKSLVTEK